MIRQWMQASEDHIDVEVYEGHRLSNSIKVHLVVDIYTEYHKNRGESGLL